MAITIIDTSYWDDGMMMLLAPQQQSHCSEVKEELEEEA